MRTEREAYIDKQLIRCIAACGDNPLPETALRDHLGIRLSPAARTQEIDHSIAYLESQRRIDAIDGETCKLWTLTDTGRAWWQKNKF